MTLPEQDQDDRDTLTPEALAVIQRARRSFAVSIGILLIGFIAIALALVYRATRDAPQVGPELTAITVPAGAEMISAVPVDGQLAVTYRLDGATVLRLIDAGSGAVIADIPVVEE